LGPPALAITFSRSTESGASRLAIAGEIDVETRDMFRDALREAISRSFNLEVDLAGITFMDSQGLRVLFDAWLVAGSPRFSIVRVSTVLHRLLEITGLDNELDANCEVA